MGQIPPEGIFTFVDNLLKELYRLFHLPFLYLHIRKPEQGLVLEPAGVLQGGEDLFRLVVDALFIEAFGQQKPGIFIKGDLFSPRGREDLRDLFIVLFLKIEGGGKILQFKDIWERRGEEGNRLVNLVGSQQGPQMQEKNSLSVLAGREFLRILRRIFVNRFELSLMKKDID